MAPTLSQVLALCGATRDEFNNLRRGGHLREDIPETTRGVARPMTRSAALEFAFIRALTDVGFAAAEAAERARILADDEQSNKLKPWLIYAPETGREICCGETGAKTPIGSMVRTLAKNEARRSHEPLKPIAATRFVAIHFAEIVRRIDTLFPE